MVLNDNTPAPTSTCLMLATLGSDTLYPGTSLVLGILEVKGSRLR